MNISHHSSTRFFFVVFIICLLYGVIVANLYRLQIQQSVFFKDLGDKQYNITVQTFPQRALIYDRHDNPVTINKDSVALFILPKTLINKDVTLKFLQQHFPSSYDRFEQNALKSFMFVKRNLSAQEIDLITKVDMEDLHFLKESSRFYPYECLGTVLGITDIDNQGLMGLEGQNNKRLQGTPTTYQLKKDAKSHHFYFGKETKQQGTEGLPLTLTIDAALQFKFQTVLDEKIAECHSLEGGALAMDAMTGEILAVVSYPNFDPNNVKNLDMESTKCRPIVNCFESGSVLKIFGAAAALQEGVTTIDDVIDCEDTKETKLDNLRIRTVHPNGKITFMEVVQNSNNIGTVKVMKRLGTDLYDYYKLFGFGEMTGLNFPGEQKGFVNHPDNWSAWSIQSLSYGYEITTSLLQLVRAMALLVNGGYLITPRLIKDSLIEKTGPLISQKTCEDMQKILEAVVQHGASKAQVSGYKVYGKTGTANILINGLYDDDRHLYTFIGAIQIGSSWYVIGCCIKDSRRATYASMITAPFFKQLAEILILHENMK
ncbi:penicillin-binding protein 2 [Candidatus Babeliales bacterium]|nr:penicillin-binding protein 2 [Candidatus Babeliales bacterium]